MGARKIKNAGTALCKVGHVKKKSLSFRMKTRQSLYSAVEKGKISDIKMFLSGEYLLNNRDTLNRTLLHVACHKGDEKMVKFLIRHGAKIDDQDCLGYTPVHLAIMAGHLGVTKILLNSPFLEGKSRILNPQDLTGQAPLYLAILHGHIHLVKLLLRHNAQVDLRSDKYETPLGAAVYQSNVQCVAVLLKIIGNISAKEEYKSIIYRAVAANFFDTERDWVLGKMFRFSKDKQLQIIEIIDLLLDAGAKLQEDDDSRIALHLAARDDNYFIVKKLLDLGHKVNCVDDLGFSVLHMAAKFASLNVVNALIKAGADLTPECPSSLLPIHFMAMGKNYKILSALINAGIDINVMSGESRSMFNYIRKYKGPKEFSFLYTIFKSGVDIHAHDEDNVTGLHVLCSKRMSNDSFGILLDLYLDFNLETQFCRTPLSYAMCFSEPTETLRSIVKAMALMESNRKFQISDENMDVITRNWLDIYSSCKTELERLKNKQVWDKITFYEFLSKPLEKLRDYSRNLELMQAINSAPLNKLFPMYARFMKKRIEIALLLKDLQDKSVNAFHQLVFPIKLPQMIIHQILSLLNFDDLERLSEMSIINVH